MAAEAAIKSRNGRRRNGESLKFSFCPCCGRKGLYKVPRSYERCRCCGLHRIILPGQDF